MNGMTALTALLTALTPSRSEGQDWANRELSKPDYTNADYSLLERVGRFFSDIVNSLFSTALGWNNPLLIIIFLAVIAVIVGFFIWRANRGVGDAFSPALFDRNTFSGLEDPATYRNRANAAAAHGDWNTAVQETVRALVAELARTGTVDITAAATAHELTGQAGRALPELKDKLAMTSDVFDAVSFGEVTATEEDFQFVREVDTAVVRQAAQRTREGVSA